MQKQLMITIASHGGLGIKGLVQAGVQPTHCEVFSATALLNMDWHNCAHPMQDPAAAPAAGADNSMRHKLRMMTGNALCQVCLGVTEKNRGA